MERYESISGQENKYDNFITKAGQHDPEDIIIEEEKATKWSYGNSSENDKIQEELVGEMAEKLVEEMANNNMGLEDQENFYK